MGEEAELWLIMSELTDRDFELEKGEWRVSEVAGCLRRAQLSRVFEVDPMYKTPEMVIGALLHKALVPEIVRIYAKKRKLRYEIELEVRDFPLVGHIDALLIDGDERIPWEWKFTFWDMEHYRNIRLGHVIEQANMYAGIIGANRYRVTVVSLADGDPVIYDKYFDFNERRYNERKMEAMSLNEAIATERLVSGPRYTWECAKCRFRIICKYIKPGEKK